jgi:hypothetical protein
MNEHFDPIKMQEENNIKEKGACAYLCQVLSTYRQTKAITLEKIFLDGV